jgi:hypothetical protein
MGLKSNTRDYNSSSEGNKLESANIRMDLLYFNSLHDKILHKK